MEIPGSMPGNSLSLNNSGQGIPVGRTPKITPQQFLGNALSFFIPKAGVAYHNRDLLGKAFQGDPDAFSQSIINIGGTFAGPTGYAVIGTDQLLKKASGGQHGLVEGFKDPRVIDAYSRTGLGGYGGLF